jgi:hypothetical protein
MQPKYDKAIAVGMAGMLLLFILTYIFLDFMSINMGIGEGEANGLGISGIELFICILASTSTAMLVVGFVAVLVSSTDIRSYMEACKVSAVSGFIPASIMVIVLVYMAFHIGLFDSLYLLMSGLAIVASCMIFSAIGSVIGYKLTHVTS